MLKAKILGKPYAGKLHVRIDEGERKTRPGNAARDPYRLFFFLYSTDLAFLPNQHPNA
jgi:hypothetical protein